MGILSVTLCGVELDNPVIPASGTFGYGKEFSEFYDLDVLGSLSFKGTTLAARDGNPLPRIAEAPGGMLNAVGLQNPGAEKVLHEELPALKQRFHKKVMANVSGFSLEDYAEASASIDDLIKSSYSFDPRTIVSKMKEIVPEFRSLNSEFSVLDRKD